MPPRVGPAVAIQCAALLVALVPACQSTRTAAPVEDHSRIHIWEPPTHRVAEGDTLYAIAWRYDLDFRDLATWNGLHAPYTIMVGTDLALAPGAMAARRPTKPAPRPPQATAAAPPRADRAPAAPVQAQTVRPSGADGVLRWRWPASGPVLARYSPRMGTNRGMNIGGAPGDPVVAAARGSVVYAGDGLARYGNLLIIKHNDTYLSAYAHCDRLLVAEGDRVSDGQTIATMGATGTNRVMLHFEIRRDGKPIDPLPLLPRR